MTTYQGVPALPAPYGDTAKVAAGMAKKLKGLVAKNLPGLKGKPVGATLKLGQTKYLGTKQEAWTDDSYFVVPVEGDLDTAGVSRACALLSTGRCGQDVSYDPTNKVLVIREIYSIGD